jgi:4-hydroxy-3-methylbut-2-enyl diphosphate reductase
MSRSAVREIQVSGIGVSRGQVLVPTQIGDPVHGLLACPAAPLVAASLESRGSQVRLADLPRGGDAAGEPDARLFLATCQQQDGTTAAIAAACAPGDARCAADARAVVEEWAAACGTRTLLVGSSPWCRGALHAAGAARQAAASQASSAHRVFVLTPAAIPAETASELRDLGAVVTNSLGEAGPGDTVVFPAHGVTADIRAEAARRGVMVVDATCPMVAAAQSAASLAADRGSQLVLIGQADHASTAPIMSHAPGHVTIAETPGTTAALRVRDAHHVTYLMQPGVPAETARPIAGALRSRYPAVRAAAAGEPCYAPSDRAGTIFSVAVGSDLMLVIGDPQSADGRQVCAAARDSGTRVQVITRVADIKPAMLTSVLTIGLAESTSAPAGLAAQVLTALSGLGRLTVARRRVSTDATASVLV